MKNILLLFGILVMLISCRKTKFDIKNLNDNKVSALGHGGMGIGHNYPMNSLESILNCLNLGADGTEIDVQMTKDGVLVAFHDESFSSTTDVSGKLYTKTWEEIKGAQYTFPNYVGYKVRRLDDLLKNIPEPSQYTFIFDVRLFQPNLDSSYFSKFNTALIAIMDKYNLVENSFVESKNEYGIQSLQLLRPDINQFVFSGFDYAFELAKIYNLSGVSVSYDELSKERIELLHANGLMASTFNTHSKKRNIKAVELNVDIIQTDKVKYLIEILQ